jgi:hypothetical protein
LRIYEIKYRTFEDPTEEEILELGLEDDDIKIIEDTFHLGSYNLVDATSLATDHLDELFQDDDYDIISVAELKGVNIVNWPDQHDGECGCPFCKAENAAPEDVLIFSCSCDEQIKVMANGWEKIHCPKCYREIAREKVLGTNGHYFLVDVDKKE